MRPMDLKLTGNPSGSRLGVTLTVAAVGISVVGAIGTEIGNAGHAMALQVLPETIGTRACVPERRI